MFKLILKGYVLVFLFFFSYAASFSQASVVPVLGFFLLIFPAFLLCCAVLVSFVRSFPIPSFVKKPVKAAMTFVSEAVR
jgi:hypothetical protein